MNSELRLRTPEGIVFSYKLAGPISRCMAWGIDVIVISAISKGLSYVCLAAGVISLDFAFALLIFIYFAVSIAYGIVAEWALRGQTIGKRLLHLRVMDAQGLRLQFHQILLHGRGTEDPLKRTLSKIL